MKPTLHLSVALAGIVALVVATFPADGRSWTNTEGKTIEANYISSTESEVVLQIGDREVTYPLAKLSKEDQEWVKSQTAGDAEPEMEGPETEIPVEPAPPEEPPTKPAGPVGYRMGLLVEHPKFDEPGGYFGEGPGKKLFEAIKAGAFPENNTGKPEDWFADRDPQATYRIYVPGSYDGTKPYGLYLHLPGGDEGEIPEAWRAELDRLEMIGVSVDQAGDEQPMLRRVKLASDAMNTVGFTYEIDAERRVVGGRGEAGQAAMFTAVAFPADFHGVISLGDAQEFPSVGKEGGGFPGLAKRDLLHRPLAYVRWAVVAGEEDESIERFRTIAREWKKEGLDYKLFEMPGKGDGLAPATTFSEALTWVFEY